MITLITPTGERSAQLELCKRWMRQQSYQGEVLWIIVDDGKIPTASIIEDDFRKNWKIHKIYPDVKWEEGMTTQCSNLKHAMDYVKGVITDLIFIIEDDDYYSPNYLQEMVNRSGEYYMIGEIPTIYYNLFEKAWYNNRQKTHTSLFQMAFKPVLSEIFINILNKNCLYIDIQFCKSINFRNLFTVEKPLALGIKGLPGRGGIGSGHKISPRYKYDPSFKRLKYYLGDDYIYYLRLYYEY